MKILKGIGVAFCGLMVLAGTINTISPPQPDARMENLVLTLIFLLCTILLIRSIRKGGTIRQPLSRPSANMSGKPARSSASKMVSPYLPEVPTEILRDMKKHYGAMQLQNDIRIAHESFQLVQQTTDFDTFFTRLELAQQKALTLLQAAQAGCKGILNKQELIHVCEGILSNVLNAKMVFLDNSYQKETASALQLKTKSGQYKRLTAYLERLSLYKDQFADVSEVYDGTICNLQNLIRDHQPKEKPSARQPQAKGKGSSADEIMKFKQLLDAGAITQEEYDTKKKQLLEL